MTASMNHRLNLTPSISCIVPAFNEAASLERVLADIFKVLSTLSNNLEIVVVDDGSEDDSNKILMGLCKQYEHLVYLQLSRNFGKESAITAGIDAARGDVVFMLDADGQHPVDLLPAMLQRWRDGSDVVYAVRRSREDQTRIHSGLTSLFYKFINFGNRVKVPPHAGDFRLMDRKVVLALRSLPERSRFMKGMYAWVGFPSNAIEYDPLPRVQGKSSFGLLGSLSLAATGVLAFSVMPLRALSIAGLALASVALGYGAWVTVEYFITGISVPGYATIVVGIMFFSGVQLLSIGILAEYVGRIYEEVKQRPSYLIRERHGSGLPIDAGDLSNSPTSS